MTDLSQLPEPALAHATGPVRAMRAFSGVSARARAVAFAAALVALSAFAFGWVWCVGHRGLFVLDESIIFDGAWRIFQGQVPYRDFVMPFGPITFWLQALLFHLLGVDFSTLVFCAGLLSVAATLLVVRLLWLLTSRSVAYSLLGGLLTAVWYQAPFGIPWLEQTAFLFDLLALLLVVEGRLGARYAAVCFFAGGIASVLAMLSKQNAGVLFVPVCLGCLCLPWGGQARATLRAVAAYAAGGSFATLVFCAWLVLCSNPRVFSHYFFSVSASVGWQRVEYWKLLGTLTFQPLLGSSIALFIACSLIGAAALWFAQRDRSFGTRAALSTALSGWLCLTLPQFQSFFQLTTNNDAPNNNAFVGVCAATCACLLGRAARGAWSLRFRGERSALEFALPGRALRIALVGLVSVALYSVGEGLSIAATRNVQEFAGASFDEHLNVPRARRLLWGEPTRITPQFCAGLGETCKVSAEDADRERPFELLHKRDFEAIAAELASRQKNFFVFPDTTLLYGLLGRPSPQPLLYFHPGQSYLLADQAELDRQIVAALQKNAVELIVLERASFMGTHKLLTGFPALKRWLDQDFRLAAEHGNYRLFERARR